MYIMISKKKKKINWLNHYSMNMDDVFNSRELRNCLGDEYMILLKKSFIKMIFYWDKIELLLKSKGIFLNARCHNFFSKKKLNFMFYEQYKETDLLDKMLISVNNLNAVIFDGWRLINER